MSIRPRFLVILTAVAGLLCASPAAAGAQQAPVPEPPRIEVSVSIGASSLFIIEGPSYGSALDVGLAGGVRLLDRLWLNVDVHRLVGLEAAKAACGLVNTECTGDSREGYDDALAGAIALGYHFGGAKAQVYLTGGFGFIRAKGFSTTTFAQTGLQVETPVTDMGWGPAAGAGVRVALTPHWSLKPEVRISGADGPNLTSLRASLALARGW